MAEDFPPSIDSIQQLAMADGVQVRSHWVGWLEKMARPVLENLAREELRQKMPIETRDERRTEKEGCSHLEALGRTLAGIAPWLSGQGGDKAELAKREEFKALVLKALEGAFHPDSPDYMGELEGGQPLVDFAFLCHGFIRGKEVLWEPLEEEIRDHILDALVRTCTIIPHPNNWLLFSAMIEAFFSHIGESGDALRVEYAWRQHEANYKGDGAYGDGFDFHWDYYNSFVMHPMLLAVAGEMAGKITTGKERLMKAWNRALRYGSVQARMIARDGSFPVIGRSISYRAGAFQLLADLAWRKVLPEELQPGMVRALLTAVQARTLNAPGTYDDEGWLQIGLSGHQPDLGEAYISTGSLYLASTALLPLGLDPEDAFWSEPAALPPGWAVWEGEDRPSDHAHHG